MDAFQLNKNIKITVWVIITGFFSCLIILLLQQFSNVFPVQGFLFAFELHFILMAWYAFSLSFLKLNYDGTYFDLKPMESNGKIYTYFGVNVFRWFLKTIGWNKISDQSNGGIIKDLNRLKKREIHTREAELAHAILFYTLYNNCSLFSSKL